VGAAATTRAAAIMDMTMLKIMDTVLGTAMVTGTHTGTGVTRTAMNLRENVGFVVHHSTNAGTRQ